jgi:uncharacterized protein
LINAWKERPEIQIREIDRFLAWAGAVARDAWTGWRVEAFPCVASNGDISLLSPEFVNIGSQVGPADFVVGNLADAELEAILENGRAAPYVVDFLRGVDDCRRDCPYFSYCGGGAASNKYFELGSTRGTTTSYCTNRVQRFADVVLELLIPEQP